MIPGLLKQYLECIMKNSEAIDIDATTYSEKQKTKQKNPQKMLQNLKTKFFMLQLNSAQYIRHWNQQEFQNTSIE